MATKKPVIAIDGTSASGKGTLARALSEFLGFAYLDTGKLYRVVGLTLLNEGKDPGDEAAATHTACELIETLDPESLQNEVLATDEIGKAASLVSAFSPVREALFNYQKNFAANPPNNAKGAVLDGRDIGTVICPKADLKLYITANPDIRAKRRHKELQSKDISVTYDAVLADMLERDARDANREASPMKPADDAIIIDTSDMGIADVLQEARKHAREKLGDIGGKA